MRWGQLTKQDTMINKVVARHIEHYDVIMAVPWCSAVVKAVQL